MCDASCSQCSLELLNSGQVLSLALSLLSISFVVFSHKGFIQLLSRLISSGTPLKHTKQTLIHKKFPIIKFFELHKHNQRCRTMCEL